MSTDFEQAVKAAAEKSVLRILAEGNWVMSSYEHRFKIPADFMADVWGLVDGQKIKAQLAEKLENELAERIINMMAAEIATDVKQILSVKERREALRAHARQHIDSIMGGAA